MPTSKLPTTDQAEQIIRNMSDEEFGIYMKEYFFEAEHNNWDGWPDREKYVCRRLVKDVAIGATAWRK